MADLTFDGAIEHSNLPPARGLTLDVAFFRVPTADTPPPFDGDPPGDAVTDCHTVYKHVDLDADSIDTPDLIPFSIAREPDIYYVQLRAMLYCLHNGN